MLAQAIKRRLSKEENQKGFTLIELLAVIVILGIIAVIAVPLIGNVISSSKDKSDLATARQLYDAARLYVIGEKSGDFKTAGGVTLDVLKVGGYVEADLYLPSTKAPITAATVTFDSDGKLDKVTIAPIPKSANSTGEFTGKQVLSSEATPSATPTPTT